MLYNLDPTVDLERAQQAAVRRGRAGAMISNLFASGESRKIDIWKKNKEFEKKE